MTLTAGGDDEGRRLDRILRRALPDMPLSGIHRMLRKGRVLVNGRAGAAEDRVAAGAVITLPDSAAGRRSFSPSFYGSKPERGPYPSPLTLHPFLPLRFPLIILREDRDLLFLNKPAGLAVHGPGGFDGQVRAYLQDKLNPSLSFRPGPLHRLDKPTSGVLAFSKTLAGARFFSALLRKGRIKKQYLAIVEGPVEEAAVWEDFLIRDTAAQKTLRTATAGTAKRALTRIRPLAIGAGSLRPGGGRETCSLILAEIATGRTHQIRAQAAARGFPLAGDKKYGGRPRPEGFFLHAWKLELPGDGEGQPRTICAPLPEQFRLRLEELFGSDVKISPDF